MIFRDISGPGIFKKKIQDFPGGVRTVVKFVRLCVRRVSVHSADDQPATDRHRCRRSAHVHGSHLRQRLPV